MGLYRGSVLKTFLIDRAAVGFDFDMIASEFNELYGMPLTQEEYDEILKNSEDDIRKREKELIEEYRSRNVYRQLLGIREELKKAQQLAMEQEDLKSFASLVNSELKSLEVLIKSIELVKKKEVTNVVVLQQNNFIALKQLEDDGIIKIEKVDELKNLFGVKDEQRLHEGDG